MKSIIGWFKSPKFPDNEDKTRSALLLNVVINTFLIAFPVIITGAILGGNVPRLEINITILIIAWLTIFGTRFAMLAGKVAVAGTVMIIVIFIATTLVIYNIGTIRAPAASFYLLTIVMSGLIISRRAILGTASASCIAIIALALAEKNGLLAAPDLTITVAQGTSFIVAFTISAILLYLAVKSIDQALTRVRQELALRKQTEEALKHVNFRLEILHEIDRALLASSDANDIVVNALASIRQLIPCPRASVTLFNLETNEAYFLAVDDNGTNLFSEERISIQEYGEQIVAILQKNRPWVTDDILADPQATDLDKRLANEIGIHAWLSLPLLSQGQLIGALNLGRYAGNSFTEEDALIAHDVANQLAIALQQSNLNRALQSELAERKKLIAELEARNDELTRFNYTVSHDLRNPLVTIKGFLGMLDKDIRENQQDRVQRDFQRIAGATEKMDALLKDLLELSRIGRVVNPPVEIDPVRLIQDALDSVDARIRSRNATVNIAPNLPLLYGDRIRLREVFENLIDNAVKYMGEQPNPLIEIGTRSDKGEQVIYIKDNGIGIEPQYLQKIFGLFEKLDPTSEGTGIGLALIKRIIEVHGGKIWVESDGLGKGSCFCFTIPDNRNPLVA